MNHSIKIFNKKSFLKAILFLSFLSSFTPFQINSVKAGLEFQWDSDSDYKRLRWHQTNSQKRAKNKIFFFYRPSDRRTGLLTLNIKVPENFKSTLKTKNISLCRVNIGGFNSKTKCLENIPADIEINNETKKVEIYPFSPLPKDKESYAVVFKVSNPQKSGLYQFHTFGKSSGAVPVASYLGSWTIKIDQL